MPLGLRTHRRLAGLAFVASLLAFLALPVRGSLRERSPPPAIDGKERLLAELAAPPQAEPTSADLPVPQPEDPPLGPAPSEHFALTVQRGRGCPQVGDALVTLERSQGLLDSVVRRGGRECFRIPFPQGPDGEEPAVRTTATVLPDGSAGPLAWVESLPAETVTRGPAAERSREEHLAVVSLQGRILLERPLTTRSFRDGAGGGRDVRLVPLVWTGTSLLAWEQVRLWSRSADECQASLLTIPMRGPIEVAEGVPCTPLSLDSGTIRAETTAAESTFDPWTAHVTLSGDLVPDPPAPPESPLFRFDLDGDGVPDGAFSALGEAVVKSEPGAELLRVAGRPLAGRVDGQVRELLVSEMRCGVAAARIDGTERCAPGAARGLGRLTLAGGSFDWTGDGTPDITLGSPLSSGRLLLVGWAEDDITFSREVSSFEGVLPLHQAPRALSLTDAGGPEVLVSTPRGFAVLGVPSFDVRWEGLAEEGVLDAWAVPAMGPSSLAVR